MNGYRLGTARVWERSLALAFFAMVTLPTLAWSQVDSSSASSHSSQTTTTTTMTAPFISDWRLWAGVGALLLVILIIAVSRGKGSGDTTTVIK